MLAMLLSMAAAGTLPAGQPMERALAIHVTQAGLAHIGDAVEGLVPPEIPVTGVAGDYRCDSADEAPLSYALSDMALELRAENLSASTADGRLDLSLVLTLSSTPATLQVTGDCTFLTDLDETCDLQLPTSVVTADLGMTMALVDGAVQVTVDDVSTEVSPIGNPLSDCVLADAIGTLLGQNPDAISDLILSYVQEPLQDLGPTIETALDDALATLEVQTSFDLLGHQTSISLFPTELRLDDRGLVLGLGAAVAPDSISDCVDAGEGSEFAGDPWPDFGETAWAGALPYDAAIFVSKDFADDLLWTTWASGALCLDLEDLTGAPIGTDILGTVFGDGFRALFPEPAPATVLVSPATAPEILFHEDDTPIGVHLRDFGIVAAAELDGRRARILRVDLDGEIGIDPGLDSTELAPSVILDWGAMDATETYDELLEPGSAEALVHFVDPVLSALLPDDLLPATPMPSLLGAGIDAVFWLPSEDGRWLGGFVLLDVDHVEPLEVSGCSGAGFGCDGDTGGAGLDLSSMLGCDSGGSSQGCDSGGGCSGCSAATGRPWAGFRLLAWLAALAFGWSRRRQ